LFMIEKTHGFPSILVIVAALNEEKGVGPTLADIKTCLDKPFCLVVDGRSTDCTTKIAESMGAVVVTQKGSGKGDAIATAIAHSQLIDARYVVFIDADYTYPAEHLLKMVRILEENPQTGMVCGNRFAGSLDFESMHNMFYVGNRLLAFAHNLLNGVHLEDPLTGLRLVRWDIMKDWKPRSKGFDVEAELNHYVERKGYGIVEVPIRYRKRLGEKKLKLRHGITIFKRILSETV